MATVKGSLFCVGEFYLYQQAISLLEEGRDGWMGRLEFDQGVISHFEERKLGYY